MTNEEAKEILNRVEIAKPIKFEDYADMREALNMAIKALEQQPCEDCISREAAKVSIQRKIDEVVSKDGSYDYDMKQYIGGLLTAKIAISRNNLPSVTPSRPKGKWMDDNCSICGYGVKPWNNTPYCPNCGADMRESEVNIDDNN